MTAWGTIRIGRLTLRETFGIEDKVNASTRVRDIVLTGQESTPPLTLADLRQRAEDISGLMGALVPVTFTDKPQYDGYYTIRDVGATTTSYPGSGIERADWNLTLSRIGPDNAVDLESRLATAVRLNDFSAAGERWHAPAGGAYAYYTGATVPVPITRASADGPITVYRALPAAVNPRWGCPVAGYGTGRVRIGAPVAERTGTGFDMDPNAWELSNGLVRVTPGSPVTLHVDAWDGTAWEPKDWNLSIGSQGAADAVTGWDAVTVVRNDHEAATVRLIRNRAPGRALLDLTLRRGSRFAEGYLRTDAATTLALWPAVAEPATSPAGTGYQSATANDAAGNRYVAGSARTWTARTASLGGFYRTATNTLDFLVGSAVGGSGAAAGDTAADLMAQYIGAPSERVMAVSR